MKQKTMKNLWTKKLTAALTAFVLSASLCMGAVAQAEDSAAETETAAEQTADDMADITLTDQAGREVHLRAPAKTIVSCYYITSYAAIALGLSDRVVGLEKKADSRPIYHMAAPGFLELPNVGSMKEFNVEAAAALQPDLVLMPAKLKEHADTLTELGIPVLVVKPETQEDMEEMLTLIAAACGVGERAESLIAYYDDKLAEAARLTADEPKQKVYMAGNASYLETAPQEMYQAELIALAGGENAASELEGDYWTEVSYETILAMNPEVIVIPAGAAYTRDDLMKDEQLAEVEAVKSGSVYQMPQEIEEWDSPIPSGILGVLWLTSVLHENVYPFAAFQADAVSFYDDFYGFAIDPELITK